MRQKQRGGVIFRLLALLVFVLLLAALYTVRRPLLRAAGNLWIASDPLEHADAIVVIGDDNVSGDRAARGAELYNAGWAPIVVASGRRLRTYAGMAELIEHDVESHGVPMTAVVRFTHRAENTIDEAKALRQLVVDRKWNRILLVTSNYHARRARYIFRKVFPTNVSVNVVPAKDSDFNLDTWWETRDGQALFQHELFGYVFALWELRGGKEKQ